MKRKSYRKRDGKTAKINIVTKMLIKLQQSWRDKMRQIEREKLEERERERHRDRGRIIEKENQSINKKYVNFEEVYIIKTEQQVERERNIVRQKEEKGKREWQR